jgi:hypothetical protein
VKANRPQERQRLPRRLDGVVTVPAQFHENPALVVNLVQRPQYVAEGDFAFAEHQVLVNAPAHVFDVDVPEHVFPAANRRPDRLVQAVQMADIEGQSEQRMVHTVE